MVTNLAHAYCTLLTNDEYLPGALVLAHSLKDSGTQVPLVILVTKEVQEWAIGRLEGLFDQIIPVDRIVNITPANLYLMDRPDLISTFTKIALWRQTQFDHLVYIDADVVALRAPDELFDLEASFAAVPDIGWPDCFNSGVMSLKPNMGDYYALLALAQRGISFDGADQGLLNMHFRNWHRLSFSYNCTPSGNYQYVPAYRHFQSTISLVHYIGRDKPWMGERTFKGASTVYEELLGRWWSVYDKHYRVIAPNSVPELSTQNRRGNQQHMKARMKTAKDTDTSASALVGAQKSPEIPASHTQEPLKDQPAAVLPSSSIEQRQYSVEWDPRRGPPPVNSRPEAMNFPNQIYIMSADLQLFQPPKKYPEPPKDLSYPTPIVSPEPQRLKPIFPWEARQTKAVRVFPEDAPPSPQPVPAASTDDVTETEPASPSAIAPKSSSPQPFASFSRTNVWDEDPGIQRYMAKFLQKRRGKSQLQLNNSSSAQGVADEGSEDLPGQRRPSIILTDFPTEVERPSLPVTPAPIRRPSFWGEERDAAGELPRAEGVPEQSEWDPSAKLVELQRRQSQVLSQAATAASRNIPNRRLIGSEPTVGTTKEPTASAAQEPTAGAIQQPTAGAAQEPTVATTKEATPLVSFGEVNFAKKGAAESNEDASELSPVS